MRFLDFLYPKRLPYNIRITYTSKDIKFPGKDKKLKLKWIEKVDSKTQNSLIDLIEKDPISYSILANAFRTFSTEIDVKKSELSIEEKKILGKKIREFKNWKIQHEK